MTPQARNVRELLDLDESSVSLNGYPAVIAGFQHPFATVRRLDSPIISAEFAWETVLRVLMTHDGEFHA